MKNMESGDRRPTKDPKPNEPSRKRSLYGCLGAILILVLILVLFGACALMGVEEDSEELTGSSASESSAFLLH